MAFSWETDAWAFVEAYLKSNNHLVSHQINSFNYFVEQSMPMVIELLNPVRLHFDYDVGTNQFLRRCTITFVNPGFHEPAVMLPDGSRRLITPYDARTHKYTYSSELVVDVRIETTVLTIRRYCDADAEPLPPRSDVQTKVIRRVCIGKVPIMIRSVLCATSRGSPDKFQECAVDLGGYFVIGGTEKVLVSVERPIDNKGMVYTSRSTIDIKSIPSGKPVRPHPLQLSIVKGGLGDSVVRVFIPQVRQKVPLMTLLRALGGGSDKDIIDELLIGLVSRTAFIQAGQLIQSSVLDSTAETQDGAVEYISRHVSSFGGGPSLSKLTGALRFAHEKVCSAETKTAAAEATGERERIDARKRISYAKLILEREVLPHVGPLQRKKRLFIGRMFRRLVYSVTTEMPDDDRDSFINKRLNTAGALLTQLFSQSLTKMVRELKLGLNKAFQKGAWRATGDFHGIVDADNIHRYVRHTIVTKALRTALSTGNMGSRGSTNLAGISQVLNRYSYAGTVSHLRRVITSLGGNAGKLLKPRALHATQLGLFCPAETPEGQQVGMVKNLALATNVTVTIPCEPTVALLLTQGCIPVEEASNDALRSNAHVFVDGDWWGVSGDPRSLVRHLRDARRRGDLHPHLSVYWNRDLRTLATGSSQGEIWLVGTPGRQVRPMFILRPGGEFVATRAHCERLRAGGGFEEMVCPSIVGGRPTLPACIEYIDVAELNTLMVAMNNGTLQKQRKGVTICHTHCELHPSLMFGILGASIPFPDHNQSPRNTYQSAMGKQAMGVYATNYQSRWDTIAHVLHSPQYPLIKGRLQDFLPTRHMPSGQMLIVAIAVNGGYNQEDSLIMNQTAIDRGLMESTMTKTYRSFESSGEGTTCRDSFCVPDTSQTQGTKAGTYDKLGADGLARVGSSVNNGDVIIGKVTPVTAKGSRCYTVDSYRDNSVLLRNSTGGIVTKTMICTTSQGGRVARVKVRSLRSPRIGDKFSSRHAQKGTVGVVRRQMDMPFNAAGITPDIIMNPHAIPSRMTVGQLLEMFLSKICTRVGAFGDATPFTGMTPELVQAFNDSLDSETKSDETLFDPTTGRPLKVKIFMCPTFYQKLRHVARDKAHARATGPMVELTRQPTEGRSRDGGLRLGEMERDCIAGHGMSVFTHESMLRRSDDYSMGVCRHCGLIAVLNTRRNVVRCDACTKRQQDEASADNASADVTRVDVPYASKLFVHELNTAGIRIGMKTGTMN